MQKRNLTSNILQISWHTDRYWFKMARTQIIYTTFFKYSWIFYKIRTKIPRGTPNDLFCLWPLSDFIWYWSFANTFSTYLTKLSVLNKLLCILHHKSHKNPILNYTKHIQYYLYIYYIIFKFLFLCISMSFPHILKKTH